MRSGQYLYTLCFHLLRMHAYPLMAQHCTLQVQCVIAGLQITDLFYELCFCEQAFLNSPLVLLTLFLFLFQASVGSEKLFSPAGNKGK